MAPQLHPLSLQLSYFSPAGWMRSLLHTICLESQHCKGNNTYVGICVCVCTLGLAITSVHKFTPFTTCSTLFIPFSFMFQHYVLNLFSPQFNGNIYKLLTHKYDVIITYPSIGGINIGVILLLPSAVLVSICLLIGAR